MFQGLRVWGLGFLGSRALDLKLGSRFRVQGFRGLVLRI